MFYDPTEELKAKREAQMIEEQKNKSNLLKDGTQNNAAAQQVAASLLNKPSNQRSNFLIDLKNKKKQKNTVTIDSIKKTF